MNYDYQTMLEIENRVLRQQLAASHQREAMLMKTITKLRARITELSQKPKPPDDDWPKPRPPRPLLRGFWPFDDDVA